MTRKILAGIAAAFVLPAAAADSLARFEGGIGSQPLRSGATPNVVHNVNPGGIPWVIASLSVDVKTDGRVSAAGRGLLLGGGNGVGTPGASQRVRARLVCGGAFHDSDLVAVEPDGDFRIEGMLLPPPPPVCASPVLLIVSAGGNWFAAGIPKL